MKKLLVSFPGINYSVEKPLLYYCGLRYEILGYERVNISYPPLSERKRSLKEVAELLKDHVWEQAVLIDWAAYEKIVFVSKSIGTVLAGWVAQKLPYEIKQLYLTPIPETLPYLQDSREIITTVVGEKDKYMDYQILKGWCNDKNIPCIVVPGVGHRLENREEFDENYRILQAITSLCE